MTIKLFKVLSFILLTTYPFNLLSNSEDDIILEETQTQMPCLINRSCLDCQTSNCNTCHTCKDNACRACANKYRRRYLPGCYRCNNSKIKRFNSFPRQCDCDRQNTRFCRLTSYCDSCPANCNVFCNRPRSIFTIRSQGSNTARELVGWEGFIYAFRPNENFITTSNTIEYTQSFRPYSIARILFGGCTLNFAGSQITDRTSCQLIADYFGLSPDFQGELRVNPIIENVIFDNQIFFGLNAISCGLYCRANMPLVWTKWNLNPVACTQNENCTNFPACSMAPEEVPATCDILTALSGNFTFGEMQQRWQYGKFSSQALTKFGVSNIDLILGYNNYMTEFYHFGFYIHAIMPTGTRPNSRYIFEPIIGNGKHFELGGGISAHLILWSRGPDRSLTGYLQGYVTHMFKNRQLRSFDFCQNGPLSRYILLKEYDQVDNELVYNGNLINAINYNTRFAEVSISVKGDASALLAYRSPCTNLDLGYNFYAQTKENVCLINCIKTIDNNLYGIKGTEDVCAIEYNLTDTLPAQFNNIERKITVNCSQSRATICTPGDTNISQNIFSSNNCIIVKSNSRQEGSIEGNDVIIAQNSPTARLVSIDNLDLESGTGGAIATHKVFGQISWFCNNTYIGIGGEVEIEGLACNEQTSLNQWGVWIKGGIDF